MFNYSRNGVRVLFLFCRPYSSQTDAFVIKLCCMFKILGTTSHQIPEPVYRLMVNIL